MDLDWRDALHASIQDSHSSFADILSHPRFYGLVVMADREAFEFLLAHFQELFDNAFQIAETYQKELSSLCLRIILTPSDPVRGHLLEMTPLVTLLKAYVKNLGQYSPRSHMSYFSNLEGLCFGSDGFLRDGFDDDSYWTLLLRSLYIDPVYDFFLRVLAGLIHKNDEPSHNLLENLGKVLTRIHVYEILVRNMFAVKRLQKTRSQILFTVAIRIGIPGSAPAALLQDVTTQRLLWLARQEGDFETFGFFENMIIIGTQFPWSWGWRSFLRVITSQLDPICEVVLSTETLSRSGSAAARLAAQVVAYSHRPTESYWALVRRMSAAFFEFPRHTAVHNCLVRLLTPLADASQLRAGFLQELDLFTLVRDRLGKRDIEITSSYWPQLWAIATLIAPLVREAGLDAEDWDATVMAPIRKNQAIIDADYGGDRPDKETKAEESDQIQLAPCVVTAVGVVAAVVVVVLLVRRRRQRR